MSLAKQRNRDAPRDAVKDDIKIIAQALVTGAQWIITDDASSFYKLACVAADMAATTSTSKLCPIKLEDGYDPSFFEPGRQRRLF
ncbi:MAG TPA: hypothetical protein VIK91_28085 [Nannocystis sp.]